MKERQLLYRTKITIVQELLRLKLIDLEMLLLRIIWDNSRWWISRECKLDSKLMNSKDSIIQKANHLSNNSLKVNSNNPNRICSRCQMPNRNSNLRKTNKIFSRLKKIFRITSKINRRSNNSNNHKATDKLLNSSWM